MKHFIRGMLFLFIDIIVMMPTAIDVPFITPACHYVHTARVCVCLFSQVDNSVSTVFS